MTVWSHHPSIFRGRHILRDICFGLLGIVFITILFLVSPAQAAPSNATINFSARLKNATGGVVPDGYYNIGFNVYDQESAGTPLWSETYYDNNGPSAGQDYRVKVVNGYFSVKLGSRTTFGSNINWDSDLWLTMNIGGVEQVSPIGNIAWDGEMTPRIQLSAVPYAMNANLIGGKSADQLVQLGQGMQIDDTNETSLYINKTGNGDIMHLQKNGVDALVLSEDYMTLGGVSPTYTIAASSSENGPGKNLALNGGSTADSSLGGNIIINGGWSESGTGGSVIIDAGGSNNENGSSGKIVLGGITASTVDIGNDTSTTTVKGSFNVSGLTLGNNSSETAGELKLASGDGFVGTISGTDLTANRSYSLPDASGTFCLQGSADCGFIMASPSSIQSGSIWLSGGASFGSNILLQTSTNSANAFRVQNNSGQLVLGVDTLNQRITIGSSDTTATLLVIDTKTDEGDPEGVNGAMYYNADRGKMRCYENGEWDNCLSNTKGVATSKTSNYTADYGDFVIADSAAGAFTITLPAPRAGAVISVKKVNAGNAINVVPSGVGVQIDNLSSISLSSQWTSQDFYSDGVRWYRV